MIAEFSCDPSIGYEFFHWSDFFFSWYVPSHLIHSYLPLISIGMLSYSLDYWERESLLFGRKFLLESKSLFCSTKIFLFALISFHFDMISIGNQLVSDFTHLSEKRGILCYEKAKDYRKRKRKRKEKNKQQWDLWLLHTLFHVFDSTVVCIPHDDGDIRR